MRREEKTQYSDHLKRDMHMIVYGDGGIPVIAFPCQDSMCNNYEDFGMIDNIADFIEAGEIQFFTVDTVDRESWSVYGGDYGYRAWVQECYYRYIVEECYPLVRKINGTARYPITFGCSLGATHAAICFFRRPDLFGGTICLSGAYDATRFWGGWCNETLYDNSPVTFLSNMPEDHPYIQLYNQRKIILCSGQGAWEYDGLVTLYQMRDIFQQKGIHAWVDLWGFDVCHDWPWWKKQIRYFLPFFTGE